jgi:hypothetical protein
MAQMLAELFCKLLRATGARFAGWKPRIMTRRSNCCSNMACRCACDARQTLHSDAKASTQYRAPLRRRQWEAPVDGVTPDLARLPAEEIGAPETTLTNDALVPVLRRQFGGTRGSSICPMRRLKSHSTRGRSRPVRVKKSCPKSNSN